MQEHSDSTFKYKHGASLDAGKGFEFIASTNIVLFIQQFTVRIYEVNTKTPYRDSK